MPTAESNKSRYVIPDNLNPTDVCCISVPVPNDPQWIAQFMGALWRMSLQTHYERDAAKSGKIVAAKWRQIWQEVQDMPCCPDIPDAGNQTITNNNVMIALYMQNIRQKWIDANFNVQVAFYQVPQNFDTDPGDTGPEVAQRDLALCLATEIFVNELFNQGMAWLRTNVVELTPFGIGAVTLAAAASTPVFIVAAGAFALGAAAAGTAYNELQRDAYREYIACTMYDNLKGKSTNDKANFDQALDTFTRPRPQPEDIAQDIARDVIEDWARAQINNLDNYLSFVQTLDAAMNYAGQTGDSCRCEEGTFIHPFLGGDGQDDLVAIPWPPAGCTATYNAVGDKFEVCCLNAPNGALVALIDLQFASRIITRVRMDVDVIATRSTPTDHLRIWDGEMDVGTLLADQGVGGNQIYQLDTGVISITTARLQFEVVIGVGNTVCPDDSGGKGEVIKITVEGEGSDPFS